MMKRTKRIILNVIGCLMCATGPFLMVLPGPQVISWAGAAILLFNNIDFINKHIYRCHWKVQYWFYWCEAHVYVFLKNQRKKRMKFIWI